MAAGSHPRRGSLDEDREIFQDEVSSFEPITGATSREGDLSMAQLTLQSGINICINLLQQISARLTKVEQNQQKLAQSVQHNSAILKTISMMQTGQDKMTLKEA